MYIIRSLLQTFRSRKMAVILLVGFSSGMPLFLTSKTLQAWMTVENVDLSTIGLFSLVGLPYSLKFLWSPFLDRFALPLLGRRRGWLITLQIGLLLAIACMGLQQPKQALQLLVINALVISFLSASQDVVVDAYRADVLKPLEMGIGTAVYVTGYRIALLLAGALALILADIVSWSVVYFSMAGCMVLGILGTLFAQEPEELNPPTSIKEAVILPFGEFFQRQGLFQGFLILLFIILYKLGDAFLNNMSTSFLLQTGFTQTDIGTIQGGMGLIATIIGTLAGGALLSQIGINRSLWIFGILQALSNLSYLVLASVGKNYQFLLAAINIENFCAGLGTAAFVAFLMSLCEQRFSATQYALLSSFIAVSRDILVAPAGALAKITGWSFFFVISFFAALPGILLLPFFAPWDQQLVAIPRPGTTDQGQDSWDTK
ncbi:AmpG family muropeptide MFS transporter [Richelia intracellularis]|uniref:AmpG family muropeptide MFS transporter n=1 Tax=Richelia intracellularis TaxID=1164990 RepID=UPI0005C640EB|nr:AmpG family muropeptide MFS transporter [Richelia intracellularis]